MLRDRIAENRKKLPKAQSEGQNWNAHAVCCHRAPRSCLEVRLPKITKGKPIVERVLSAMVNNNYAKSLAILGRG